MDKPSRADPAAVNPYAPSAHVDEQPLPPDAPQYRLFSVAAITVGAFLGGLASAGLLMLCNFARLGRAETGWGVAAVCTAGTLAVMALGVSLPDDVPSLPFLLVQMGIAYGLAKWLQEPLIKQHQARGGQMASMWWAVGVAIMTSIVLVAILLLALFLLPESWLPPE